MQPSNKPKSTETQDYECMVCLQLLRKPMKCQSCKKRLCSKHVGILNNKCPHCRCEPFKVVAQPELHEELNQRYIQKLKSEFPPQKIIKCHAEKCSYESHISNMLKHHKCKHPELDIQLMLFGPDEQESKIPMATQKQTRRALYACQQANNPRPGERMKIPSYKTAMWMATHVNRCDHEQCRSVWTGPWGSFVGGIKGDLYFDLTECPIGWNYHNFRN